MMTTKAETGWLDRPLARVLALDVEKLLYAAVLIVAIVTRFYDLGARVMSHDESLHTYYSYRLYRGEGFQHTPLMHGPFQFHIIALSYFIFGDSDFTARIPAALFGVLSVGLMYFFRPWLGRIGALVSAVLIAISPYILYYSRYTRNESYVVVWALLAAWATFRYLESRQVKWLFLLTGATAFHTITKETSFIYVAVWLILLDVMLVRSLLAVDWRRPDLRRTFGILLILGLIVIVAGGLVVVANRLIPEPLNADTTAIPVDPNAETLAGEAAGPAQTMNTIGLYAAIAGVSVLGLAHLVALAAFGREIRRFAAFDLLILLGTFILPQLAAFPVRWLGGNPIDYTTTSQLVQTGIVFGVLMVASIAIGLAWDLRVWLICAAIWYGIYIPFQTTIFTNGDGLWTGMVGSLGYWLVQQGVERGSQPWYYYVLVQLAMYEFLPVVGSLIALGYVVYDWLRGTRPAEEAEPGRLPREMAEETGGGGNGPDAIGTAPFLGFTGAWAALAIAALTVAGEKMPWLTVHLTLPLILIAGWGIARLIRSVDWAAFWFHRGWLTALLLPVLITSLAFSAWSLLGNQPPFQGRTVEALRATSSFLATLAVAGIALAGLYFAGRDTNWMDLGRLTGLMAVLGLTLITARTAFAAAFIRYDEATEYLVYAHSATGVKTVMDQVEEISLRLNDSLDVRVAYDDDVAWPMTWYMRRFRNQVYYGAQPTREALDSPLVIAGDNNWARVEPLLGNRYYTYEYIRMVWPMQEYFNLDAERVRAALTSRDYRQAILDIWWARDYDLYGQLTGVDYRLSRWPVVDRMRFYVRKDIAAQIWEFGVGPTALAEPAPEDPYAGRSQTLTADLAWGTQGSGGGQFNLPRDVAVAPDGSVYVADTFNHRIQKFDAEGGFLLAFGGDSGANTASPPPGAFREPWGVGIGPDGAVYVADTWNHRIQKFTPDGQFLAVWGVFGQGETPQSFWGPRDVAVDPSGRVFVADTGNKRIVIFDSGGGFLSTVGQGAGYEPGYFDEPVGVAIGPDGRLYVADIWNGRVQVFEELQGTGEFKYSAEWPVVAWFGRSLDNKPYIAVDGLGRVFVTDPEGYRVLAFGGDGQILLTWGDFGTDLTRFGLPVGLSVDSQNRLYVADAKNHRIMRFAVP